MDRQLIIARKSFLKNLAFESNQERQRYILDYLEIGSVPLRCINVYAFRIAESNYPIEGEELRLALNEESNDEQNRRCACFCISTGDFVLHGSRQENQIIDEIENYVGIAYCNY